MCLLTREQVTDLSTPCVTVCAFAGPSVCVCLLLYDWFLDAEPGMLWAGRAEEGAIPGTQGSAVGKGCPTLLGHPPRLPHPTPTQSPGKGLPVLITPPLNVSKPVSVFWPLGERSGLWEEKGMIPWVGDKVGLGCQPL